MANYYTQFSFIALSDLTEAEKDWIEKELDTPDDLDHSYYFDRSIQGSDLWIYTEESGTPEDVADFLQAFLSEFRPDQYVTFEWANVCNKPVLNAFGGGGAIVTAKETIWFVPSYDIEGYLVKKFPTSEGD